MQANAQVEKKAGGALRLFIVGVLTIVATIVANIVVRALAFAIWPISPLFPPLQIGAISVFTTVLVGMGVLVYALVVRFSKQPTRTYTIVAFIALVLSYIPTVTLFFNGNAFPGTSSPALSILLVLHSIDAIITIMLLTRLAPSKGRAAKEDVR